MKVLHIVAGLDTGGVAMLLYQYLSHLQNKDLYFDFIVHDNPGLNGRRGRFEEKFEALGSHIYNVPPKKKKLFKNLMQVSAVMKIGNYDAVHVHNEETSGLYTALACVHRIPVRVVHSHYAYKYTTILKNVYNLIMKCVIKATATNWIACSQDAGIALYGKNALKNNKFTVIHNAIEIDSFVFNEDIRKKVRMQLGIDNHTFVLIDVGRFTYQKNPERAIEIFREIHNKDKKALFLMVGIGELEEKIRILIQKSNLEKNVCLLSTRDDVNELLQASDVFLLPTRFEGLGIVYVEAQAAGLPSFGTAGKIPKEAKVSNLMHFCFDEAGAEEWANDILKAYSQNNMRISPIVELQQNGYDINIEAIKLLNVYDNRRKGR